MVSGSLDAAFRQQRINTLTAWRTDEQRHFGVHVRAHADDGAAQPDAARAAPEQEGELGRGK